MKSWEWQCGLGLNSDIDWKIIILCIRNKKLFTTFVYFNRNLPEYVNFNKIPKFKSKLQSKPKFNLIKNNRQTNCAEKNVYDIIFYVGFQSLLGRISILIGSPTLFLWVWMLVCYFQFWNDEWSKVWRWSCLTSPVR